MTGKQLPHPRIGWSVPAAGLLLLIAFAVPAVMLSAGPGEPVFKGMDRSWEAYSISLHTPLWDGVNAVLNVVGYTGALVLHALLVLALLVSRRPRTAMFVAASGIAALAITQAVKALVGRHRPDGAKVLTDTGSYPSGHVSATTALVVVVALLVSRWWMTVLASLASIAMMISRTYLSAHWLTDVVGGACLATGVVLLLWWGLRPICREEN